MKKKIKWFIISIVGLSMTIAIVTLHYVYREKISIVPDNIHAIRLTNNRSIYTEDKDEIKIIIDFINAMTFYNRVDPIVGTSSPNAWVTMYDKNGGIVDSIRFYGIVVHYQSDEYTIEPFAYLKIDQLLRRLGQVS